MSGQRGRLILKPRATDGTHDGAPGSARHLARHIRRMALLLRGAVQQAGQQAGEQAEQQTGQPTGVRRVAADSGQAELTGRELAGLNLRGPGQPGPNEAGQEQDAGPGWWVLAQGGVLNESDFEAREAVREELLARVRRAGVLVGENVWVWDLSGRAQLVLSTLPTLERARKVALRLREKGLAIVVRREMP